MVEVSDSNNKKTTLWVSVIIDGMFALSCRDSQGGSKDGSGKAGPGRAG